MISRARGLAQARAGRSVPDTPADPAGRGEVSGQSWAPAGGGRRGGGWRQEWRRQPVLPAPRFSEGVYVTERDVSAWREAGPSRRLRFEIRSLLASRPRGVGGAVLRPSR